ncbi:MAG TPA: hemerythrin domain-containing protein [Acidimicrobiales bacterium]
MTGQPKPDLIFVTLIHQALRVDAERLVAATSTLGSAEQQRLAGVRVFFDEYRAQLGVHHTHEDNIFFPALRAVVDESRIPVAELADQHGALDADLQSICDGFASLANPSCDFDGEHEDVVRSMIGLAKRLDAHLRMEEESVLPLMLSAVPQTTYEKLEAQARKRTSGRRARFLIPWIIEHATPDQRKHLFKIAPPLRAAYLINRHGYRVLDRTLQLTHNPPQGQHAFD